MDSYAAYRMTGREWIGRYKDKMGEEHFKKYLNLVYRMLFKMKPGEVFTLDNHVRPENIELFIKIVCLFISEGNSNYDFTNDYKKIRCHERIEYVKEKKMDGKRG